MIAPSFIITIGAFIVIVIIMLLWVGGFFD
jgi:hypothetical protein